MKKRVLIIQGQMKQYRIPFFAKLRSALKEDGITLRVGYSDPPPHETRKKDNCDLSSEYGVKVKGYWGFGQRVVWQPLIGEVAAADLIIIEQANKHIINHLLILCSAMRLKKVAFWGLGENKQAGPVAISEWYRRKTLNRTDWWFAYTAGTADFLVRQGVARAKITAVQNSVDTQQLRDQIAAIPRSAISEQRKKLGIMDGAPVGVFCGMLDRVKAVPLLIDSAKRVKSAIPEFHLIVAGGGSDGTYVEKAASASCGWIHWVGPKFGADKALIMKMANVFLLPGRVGLAILDAFAAGLPIVTTNIFIHGPEIEYLEEGVNGLKVQHEVGAYAKAVIDVLENRVRLQKLSEGAMKSADRYSIEAMVRNFHEGITRCLALK